MVRNPKFRCGPTASGSVTEGELLNMTFEVSHYFEKELTWLLGNYFEYINKEAIAKDKVVKAVEMQSVLKGRKVAMQQRRAPGLNLFNL